MTGSSSNEGCPMSRGNISTESRHNTNEKNTPISYNSYLRINELKQLQICESNPAHHDEPLFIIIHQAYELWFKLILHELDSVAEFLKEHKLRKATFYLKRVAAILKLLVSQIHLLETMRPQDFLGFRYNLSPASGFQSSQFRELEFFGGLKSEQVLQHFHADPEALEQLQKRYKEPSLLDLFETVLVAQGFDLPKVTSNLDKEEIENISQIRLKELSKIYSQSEKYPELYDLAESLIEIDELVSLWRTNHVTVVERMIGFKRGTGGSEGVAYLRSTLEKRFFPELWQLRTYLEDPNENSSD